MSEESHKLFQYDQSPHQRRHGPRGYTDYSSYKPWLRDEFHFRCVFCLCRERWWPDGEGGFSVEHFIPKSIQQSLVCEYHNLLLACCACNSSKQDAQIRLNPCEAAMADHLEVKLDGTMIPLTSEGEEMLQVCHLNRKKLKEYRERMIQLWITLEPRGQTMPSGHCIRFFGYPDDLPDLTSLRPPGGNSVTGSEVDCYHERRKRGELTDIY